MKTKQTLRKRGQEEILGFVLIAVLVVIILLVLLVVIIGQSSRDSTRESVELVHFLDTVIDITTECATTFEPDFSDVQNLIVKAGENAHCTSGKSARDALDTTLAELLELSWPITENSNVKGYKLEITRETNNEDENIIDPIVRGVVGGSTQGADKPIAGGITVSFDVAFSSG